MRPNFAILTAAFCLCGCAGGPGDPSTRAGLWTPEHYNDSNLKAMVANPDDLQQIAQCFAQDQLCSLVAHIGLDTDPI